MHWLGTLTAWSALSSVALGAQFPESVALTFPEVPAVAGPPAAQFHFSFLKPAGVGEKRMVFRVEARRLADDAVVGSVILDNGEHGYLGDSGELSGSVPIADPSGDQIYFHVRACPWSLNRAVVEQYTSYPTDGTYTYRWSGGGYGVTQDLYYLGALIAPTNAEHTTYCSGITFETFLKSWEIYNTAYGHSAIGTLTASSMESYRRVWYGVTDADRLVARAIADYDLGQEITDWEEMQEGDFVQFWRHSGSGHSVVFVGWERNPDTHQILGFHYWSSQSSTNGIGYGTEYFGDTWGVNPDRFWPARLRKPRDAADVDWGLGESDTKATPTTLLLPECEWILH